ncbi:MAG: hypothetical protein ACM3JD_17670 [Rudaea sp.]
MKTIRLLTLVLAVLLMTACGASSSGALTPEPAATFPAAPSASATAGPAVPTAVPASPAASATAPETAANTPAAVTLTPLAAGGLVNLHQVDWNSFLAATPNLDHPAVPPPTSNNFGPYVQVRTGLPQTAIQGFAMTDGILYLNFSDDGQEEAVISLFSGGTGGNFGLLVYKAGPAEPVLAAYLGGYKIGAIADGNQLLVREPIYAGWEPNCCPGGISETHYRLQGNQLVVTSRTANGIPEMRLYTVQHFYELLQQKKYDEAYAFLSPRFRAAQPFDAWKAGYQGTVSFTFQTADRPDGSVAVDLTSVDQTPAGQVTRRFRGTWTLVWSDAAKQWLLDRGLIGPVP